MSPLVRTAIQHSPCPKCKATPGRPCRTPSGRATEIHDARVHKNLFDPPYARPRATRSRGENR